MNRFVALCAGFALALSAGANAHAADIYVSSETGANDNPGTKEKPLKLLWKVMAGLKDGDHVYVAEGRQEGQAQSGVMPVCECSHVTLEGGWKKDFSERDPFKYLTIIGPPADQQGAGTAAIDFHSSSNKIDDVTIDGFVIDRGEHNYYYSDGEPGANKRVEGHADNSCWGYQAINKKKTGSPVTINLNGMGKFTVRNNVLVNNGWWAIYVKCGGDSVIENNLVLIAQGRAIEALGAWNKPSITVRNNTVAFVDNLGQGEGRALSIDPKPDGTKYVIERNVFAFCDGAAIDTKFAMKSAKVELTDNLFFFNRLGDIAAAEGGGVAAKQFGDELSVPAKGNVGELPKFCAKLAKEWVARWSIKETPDMLGGKFNKEEHIAAVRAACGLPPEYSIPGYDKTFPDYKSLPQKRNNYDMSRYPHPMKKGELINFQEAVMGIVGADGDKGIKTFAAAK